MSTGPIIPVTCSTIELNDLADTIDFDADATAGVMYGLEFTAAGYYKRTVIPASKAKPSIDQLKVF